MSDRSSSDGLWWLHLPAVTALVGDVATDFAQTAETGGYVPNLMLALANAPGPFGGMRALYRALMASPEALLSREERELIAVVVSVENRCDLCVVGHASALRALTGDAYKVGVIEVNYRRAGLSGRQRALADFAIEMTRAPAMMEPDSVERLRSAGLTEAEILEAAYVAAYYNMTNRIMSALGVKAQREAFFAFRQDKGLPDETKAGR